MEGERCPWRDAHGFAIQNDASSWKTASAVVANNKAEGSAPLSLIAFARAIADEAQ